MNLHESQPHTSTAAFLRGGYAAAATALPETRLRWRSHSFGFSPRPGNPHFAADCGFGAVHWTTTASKPKSNRSCRTWYTCLTTRVSFVMCSKTIASRTPGPSLSWSFPLTLLYKISKPGSTLRALHFPWASIKSCGWELNRGISPWYQSLHLLTRAQRQE